MSVQSFESVGMDLDLDIDMDVGCSAMAFPHLSQSLEMSADEAAKKIRKPYTITKSRESWTEQEHDKFLEALQLYERDWKKIEAFIGSKTVIQIRSHAQKYFLKVQKNGTGEHVPPPRPKRKSSQPYPHKASKYASPSKQTRGIPSSSQSEPMYLGAADLLLPPVSDTSAVPSWVHHTVPPASIPFDDDDMRPEELENTVTVVGDPTLHSSGSSSGHWSQPFTSAEQCNSQKSLRETPDFSEVYKFIGSVFDPDISDQLDTLKRMIPIDRETVLLLMKNLALNLSSPDFEGQKLMFASLCHKSCKAQDEQGKSYCRDVNEQLSQPMLDNSAELQALSHSYYSGGNACNRTRYQHKFQSLLQ
ncbi:hypothetical protein O6H91_03G021300 [Diphasiastrum complanatum]|uniref:Uncharacterized protein n=1 Tax=Diphasiastrum complanatum TaxID=34168 RepID=A0ACC2E479_DIPCM|nr:hypothetical protein O6H91_03G021300 [Diphasiastrum complanatum]